MTVMARTTRGSPAWADSEIMPRSTTATAAVETKSTPEILACTTPLVGAALHFWVHVRASREGCDGQNCQ